MLEVIGGIAGRLHPWRGVLWLCVLGGAGVFVWALLVGDDVWLLPSLAVVGALASVAVIAQSFHPLPPRPQPGMSWLTRISLRLKRALAGCLALLVLCSLGGALFLGLRALTLLL